MPCCDNLSKFRDLVIEKFRESVRITVIHSRSIHARKGGHGAMTPFLALKKVLQHEFQSMSSQYWLQPPFTYSSAFRQKLRYFCVVHSDCTLCMAFFHTKQCQNECFLCQNCKNLLADLQCLRRLVASPPDSRLLPPPALELPIFIPPYIEN